MPDKDSQDRLRIGGWVPPYRDANGPLRPPSPPAKLTRRTLPAGFWPVSSPSRATSTTGRRAVVALATGALLAVAGLTALSLRGDDPAASLTQRMVLPPLEPTDPVSVEPAPSATDDGPGSVIRTPTHHQVTTRPAEKARTTPPATRPRTTAPTVTPPPRLAAGATVGLELAERPGYRLRHRDFVARLDPVGAGSSARDDARFTVRAGLARDECFSLEAGNFPGFFLRHRDFVLRLDRRDGSRLYDQDATFCPRPTRDGDAVLLESVNYPGYFLFAQRDGVALSRRGASAFVVRRPL